MIKRTVATFMLIISLFFLTAQTKVSANENGNINQPFTAPQTAVGTLTSDTGEVENVVGTLVEENQGFSTFSESSSDTSDGSATYEYSVYANRTGSLSVSQTDGAVAVRVRLVINFTETTSGLRQGKIDMVSGSWTRIDPTVRVTSQRLIVGTTGYTPSPVQQSRTFNNVPANFAYSTGFTRMTGALQGSAGANLTLNIARGTGSYTFRVTNNLF
ncbi:hypothetical protein [Marinilactibacillus kalidii]|uniref:hypothetical protein n=1 Tax=Marinilactibacillus kalidii TaxID=2820274 RepID=UPI001ABE896B|nr:hypothetical protein [Marinilactibacillus kalidii]